MVRPTDLVIGGIALVAFVAVLLIAEDGILDLLRLRMHVRLVNARVEALSLENQRLAEQILELKKNPREYEWLAREQLGLVRANELVYLFGSEE